MKRGKIQIDNGFGVEDKIENEIKFETNIDHDETIFDFFESYMNRMFKIFFGYIKILMFCFLMVSIFDILDKTNKTIHQEATYDILQSEVYNLKSEYLKYHLLINKITIDRMVTDEEFDVLLSIMNNDENLNLITKLVIFEVIKKSESSEYVKNHIEKTFKILEGENNE
ncbi:hypothetical protein Q6U52_000845 [Vibrio alginolyticus]|nr:hypothetical protein [Vibrio alginolyticus]